MRCADEDCRSGRRREERDAAYVVESSAASLELERAQPGVLVFLDVVAADHSTQQREVLRIWRQVSSNNHYLGEIISRFYFASETGSKCSSVSFPRGCALLSTMGKVLQPLRHRDLHRVVGGGGGSADRGFAVIVIIVSSWRYLQRHPHFAYQSAARSGHIPSKWLEL